MIEYKSRIRRKRSKQTLKTETRKAVRSLIITLTSMIIVLSIVFLAITTQNAQKGYALKQAKLRNEQLKSDNASISSRITNSTAFSKIEDSKKILEMEEIEEKDYVTKEDNMVE